ncbi:MAG: hypothetical protein HRT47_06185 [Candidatus Caenarcaniphilales bacterium]|nr:hypothetical protein [Candidatus Caenarcaniphilales bacterium]
MTNVNNNRSKLFVNDDGTEDVEEQKDILAARAKDEDKPVDDLKIAFFRKVKLELSAA